MQRIIYLFLCAVLVTFSSCSGEGPNDSSLDTDTTGIDTSLGIDTTDINPIDTVAVDSAGYIDEDAALTSQIEKKYGVQWDFCDCVVKNDSLESALMDTDDDAQIDLILERWEIVDNHCKEILNSPNTTPDERARHERKVNKCLKGAK